MKRTSPLILILLALAGGGAGYLLDHLLTVGGRATFSPSGLLPVLLVILAGCVLAVAWPVRRSARGLSATRVDPFRAMRVAILAKASSLLGAIMTGFGSGLLVFLLSRPVGPQVGSVVSLAALVGTSLVLVAAALVAEQFCTLPKDPDDRQPHDPTGADGS